MPLRRRQPCLRRRRCSSGSAPRSSTPASRRPWSRRGRPRPCPRRPMTSRKRRRRCPRPRRPLRPTTRPLDHGRCRRLRLWLPKLQKRQPLHPSHLRQRHRRTRRSLCQRLVAHGSRPRLLARWWSSPEPGSRSSPRRPLPRFSRFSHHRPLRPRHRLSRRHRQLPRLQRWLRTRAPASRRLATPPWLQRRLLPARRQPRVR